jgi:putative membrane protein
MMGQGEWGAGSWLMMSVLMLIVLALLVGATAWLLTRRRESPAARSARQILDERLARGDITEDEYRRRCDLMPPLTA